MVAIAVASRISRKEGAATSTDQHDQRSSKGEKRKRWHTTFRIKIKPEIMTIGTIRRVNRPATG